MKYRAPFILDPPDHAWFDCGMIAKIWNWRSTWARRPGSAARDRGRPAVDYRRAFLRLRQGGLRRRISRARQLSPGSSAMPQRSAYARRPPLPSSTVEVRMPQLGERCERDDHAVVQSGRRAVAVTSRCLRSARQGDDGGPGARAGRSMRSSLPPVTKPRSAPSWRASPAVRSARASARFAGCAAAGPRARARSEARQGARRRG